MLFSAADSLFMAQAQRLSAKGLFTTDPNPRVGCVIVNNGVVVGEGYHRKAGGPHAEVYALREAGSHARGGTAYVTLEPCAHTGRTPPCALALITAKVARVVIAQLDPNPLVAGKGVALLEAAGIAVEHGLQAEESQRQNPGFLKRMAEGRPFVRLKLAMSLDGRTAMANGESQWITGSEARQDVQRMRARSNAILTGIGTVLADDPALNVRLPPSEETGGVAARQPLPVILDSQLRCSASAQIFSLHQKVLLMHAATASSTPLSQQPIAHCQPMATDAQGGLDLHAVMRELARLQVNECHVECGAILAGSLMARSLVDELVLYVAPKLLGSDARGLLAMPQLQHLKDSVSLDIEDVATVGKDLRITCRPSY